MAGGHLTETLVRDTPTPPTGQLELWDDDPKGFGLRISAGGSRTYFVMRRLHGRLLRRTVGEPLLPGQIDTPDRLTLKEARKRARLMLDALEAGRDPGRVRRTRAPGVRSKAPEADGDESLLSARQRLRRQWERDRKAALPGTFLNIAHLYLCNDEDGIGAAELKSRDELERKLHVDLITWHRRPINTISSRDIIDLLRTKRPAAPIAGNRLLSFIKRVFRFALNEQMIDLDPSFTVAKRDKETPRKRYLDENEIRLFWMACDRLGDPAGRMFKLALVTLQRRGEVAGLRYSELGQLEYKAEVGKTGRDAITKGDAWLLPAERTKRGVANTIPLSPLAKALIDGAPRLEVAGKLYDHIFPSGRRGDQPVTGWSRFKERLDDSIGRIMAEEAEEDFDAKKHRLPNWHLHDLRATGATHLEMARLGVSRTVISRILNHSEGDGRSMTARYIRHTWDREAADALEAWAAELQRMTGENVIAITGRSQ